MRKLTPFKQALLGGLTALALCALIFTAGAVAAQGVLDPEDASGVSGSSGEAGAAPEPSALTLDSASGVLTVFQTTATYNGAGPAGYGRTAMHAACRAEDPASHFCTIQEIETAWKTGGLNMTATSQSWVDNAITGTINPDYTGDTSLSSDWYGGNATGDYPYNCNGWINSTNLGRGLILNNGAISPAAEACDDVHPVACCK